MRIAMREWEVLFVNNPADDYSLIMPEMLASLPIKP